MRNKRRIARGLKIMLIGGLAVMLPIEIGEAKENPTSGARDWTTYRTIAHALGNVDGMPYTNTYEAFLLHYGEGQRIFETDLNWTTDDKIALVHDWIIFNHFDEIEAYMKQGIEQPLSMQAFKSTRAAGYLHTLSLRDMVTLMKHYPDMYLILDTKTDKLEDTKKLFRDIRQTAEDIDSSVLTRMIPELFDPEMYRAVMDIYPFPNKLYSLYKSNASPEEVAAFVRQEDIRTVAMPVERVTPSYMSLLRDSGALTYVHTVNNEEDRMRLVEMGVHGIYSDSLKETAEALREAAAAPHQTKKEPSWWRLLPVYFYKFLRGVF